MFTAPTNPPVRRRLFDIEDVNTEARIDNFANVLKESLVRERMEKARKWNFDFANEVPLDGAYQWCPAMSTDIVKWIGLKPENYCDEKNDILLPMPSATEITPKTKEDDALPILRKRRRNDEVVPDKAVRRKLSFD